ncbi:response regulator transcription factor [Sabulicella glaciei]|uniref:Response regulator n=1 Tax=Sabulicella glaciei TaxID=2984948 RepID=A0ABT3NWJ5_9PROT|nr:response regulator [Roseococcus sp. MDT2-1-1]MCW8086524.1 response regulator [Roseococcus sp. MDT2-1-1]
MEPVLHVVDDEEAVRRSLAMLLMAADYNVETYADAAALLGAASRGTGLAPGCLILDVRMPGMDGLSLMEELSKRGITHPAIVVTGHADVPLAVRAMRVGAIDFLEKPYTEERLLEAVKAALAAGDEATRRRSAETRATAQVTALSPREKEVLECLVQGMANKVVAHKLGISPRTVEVHRANLMDKLNARSLPELVRIGLAAGM